MKAIRRSQASTEEGASSGPGAGQPSGIAPRTLIHREESLRDLDPSVYRTNDSNERHNTCEWNQKLEWSHNHFLSVDYIIFNVTSSHNSVLV